MGVAPVRWVDLGPGIRAGFTARGSSGSPEPWDGANLGLGVGDDPVRVHQHRRDVGAQFGVPVVFATQVHGVVVADADRVDAATVLAAGTLGEADALVTTRGDIALGVLVADCVPVLLADWHAGVVGVAHAGRRGLHEGVMGAVVSAMTDRGAEAEHLRAVVGPCVCGRCYEVPTSMCDEVAGRRPATRSITPQGTPALDLAAGVLGDLAALGVSASRVEVCTREDEKYFSHRRAQERSHVTGRFAGIVRLVPKVGGKSHGRVVPGRPLALG